MHRRFVGASHPRPRVVSLPRSGPRLRLPRIWAGAHRSRRGRQRRSAFLLGCGLALIAATGGQPTTFSAATYVVTTTNGAATFTMAPFTYPQTVLVDQPLFYHRLNESSGGSTTAADASTNGYAGTYDGTTQTVPAPSDVVGGISGDTGKTFTTANWLYATNASTFNGNGTVEFWTYLANGATGQLIGLSSNTNGLNGGSSEFYIGVNSGQLTIKLNFNSASGQSSSNTSQVVWPGITPSANTWHHIVFSMSSSASAMNLYVDGVQTSVNWVFGVWALTANRIWKVFGNDAGNSSVAGSVNDVAIYNTALSSGQVTNHYAARTGSAAYSAAVMADSPSLYWKLNEAAGASTTVDSSGSGNTGNYGWVPTADFVFGFPGPLGGASASTGIALNGKTIHNNHVMATAATTTFSAEAWFQSWGGNIGEIIGFGDAASGNSTRYDRNVYLDSNGKLEFGTYDVGSGQHNTIVSPLSYNDNAWHMVTVTLTPSYKAMYVDGSLVASTNNASLCTAQTDYANGYWRLAGDNLSGWPNPPGGAPQFAGHVDEWSVYTTELSAARVLAHWNARNV